MQFLEKLIEATAWGMEKPPAYGGFHLTFTFVGLAVCILLAYLLRNTGERGNRIVLWSVGGFLALTEIYKQLFYYFYIGDHSYQWWIFPFQLCSVPMYLCLIAPFLKKGKVQIAHCENETAAQKLKDMILTTLPHATVNIHPCRGLCSYYAEKGGLLVGYEKI